MPTTPAAQSLLPHVRLWQLHSAHIHARRHALRMRTRTRARSCSRVACLDKYGPRSSRVFGRQL
eukprot:2684870-Alexandrium_andersonii.AAC.1